MLLPMMPGWRNSTPPGWSVSWGWSPSPAGGPDMAGVEELWRLVCLLIITAGLFLFLLTTKSFWLPFVVRWLMVGDKDLQPADVIIVLSGEEGERVAIWVKLYQERWLAFGHCRYFTIPPAAHQDGF